jgi:hypothetical protein
MPASIVRLGVRHAVLSCAALFIAAGVAPLQAQYPVAPTPVLTLGSMTREPRFSGYISARETLRSDTSTFTINRARLGVQALPVPYVAVRLQADFAAVGRTTGASGDTIPALQVTDAFIQLGLPDTASRIALLLRPSLMIGQFRTPFGLEALTSFSAVITANRSLAAERLSTRRDRGVQAQVRFPRLLTIGAAVVDGEGANRTNNPDGRQMAIGRLTLLPMPTLSVSGKWAGQGSDHRWGYDARWVHGPAVVEGELIEREGPTNATTRTDARAGYVLAAYRILPWLQPVVKWEQLHETLTTATTTAPSRLTHTTVGVNFIAQERFRMQLNWIEKSEWTLSRKGEFIAQFQAIF